MADRIGGYPKKTDRGWVLTDGAGKTISTAGQQIGCSKIRPGAPGHWIDSHRCSYRFKVNGRWYSLRGYGAGIAASGRAMKSPPKGLAGFSTRRRKRRK